jgi:hypothetical protein
VPYENDRCLRSQIGLEDFIVTLTCRYGTVVSQMARIGCPQHTADVRLGRASATFNQIEEQP